MKVAVVQSDYIPWKGYFDLIRAVDVMILYDDAQYTVRDWRNRNRIKTGSGLTWLTIPVETKGRRFQAVKDVKTSNSLWGKKHWQAIVHAYAKAPYFKTYRGVFEPLYLNEIPVFLSEINRRFIDAINEVLCVRTKVRFSMDYPMDPGADKTEKLLNLCRSAGATLYLSGPTAKDYLRTDLFEKEAIRVRFADYSGYPAYPQFFPPFVHQVSILDLIFHTGEAAPDFLKELSV